MLQLGPVIVIGHSWPVVQTFTHGRLRPGQHEHQVQQIGQPLVIGCDRRQLDQVQAARPARQIAGNRCTGRTGFELLGQRQQAMAHGIAGQASAGTRCGRSGSRW